MHEPGCLPRCWRAICVIALFAAALLPSTLSAQRTSRPPAYRSAQLPAIQLDEPGATSQRPNEGEADALRLDSATEPEVIEAETLPPNYQVPLRQSADGLVIHAEDGLISLAARGASVSDVITALAELQGLNVITQDSVTGTLNTTLNRVPIQDALDVILDMTGHTWTRNKNIILVTSVAQSTRLSPESQGRQVELFELDYVSATDVSAVVTNMLSAVGSASMVESAEDDSRRTQELLVVEDLPRYLNTVREYIRQADVPPRQVTIEAYILKVDLSDDMRHGVNFDHLFDMSSNMFQLEGRGFGSASASQGFFVNLSGGNLTAMIEMLETATDAKTLAAPKIRVLNGQTARMQVGEQLGFRVTTITETAATETVEFLDVGVVLEVTPRIARDGTVVMSVRPEVSSGQVNAATGLPEEETTELETDVMFRDNQAFIIGGLIQEVDTETQAKIPWFGDWNHIGRVFQRREKNKSRSEIIIALLPRVMPFDPMTEEQYQVETERARTPLLQGALEEYPRPWEPQLRDAIENPITYAPRSWKNWLHRPNCRQECCRDIPGPKPAFQAGEPTPAESVPIPDDIDSSASHSRLPPPVYTARRPNRLPPIKSIHVTRLPPPVNVRPASAETQSTSPIIRRTTPGTIFR